MIPQLSSELLNAAKALGLLNPDGSLRSEWFSDPSQSLMTILSNKNQRTAFLGLLDDLLPPEPISGLPAGEKWHPLLGEQPRGNIYLTAKNGSTSYVDFGLAGLVTANPGSATPATLRARLPVARFDQNSGQAIAGTATGPLEISLRLETNWTKGPQHSIGLKAARVDLRIVVAPSPDVSVKVMLEKLDLDGSGPKDTLLDPESIGPEAVKLVVGLLGEKLRNPTNPGDEANAAASHLLGVLGLSGNLPPLPLTTLTKGPAAFQGWLNALIAQPTKMAGWLEHLAGLFGATVNANGTGTSSDPWRVRLTPVGSGALNLTAAVKSGYLHLGLEVALLPADDRPRIEAQAIVVGIPLAGNGSPVVLPSVTALLRAPGTGNTPLVSSAPQIAVASLVAGFGWNGSSLAPVFELLNVTLNGTNYPKIDLTSAGSVVATLSSAIQTVILDALGNAGAGRHLAALAGLVPPASDPGWPAGFMVDPAVLVSDPARAIGAVHRSALVTPAHHWGHLFGELAGLLGLNTPVSGAGTRQDPWRTPFAPGGGLSLQLAAWNDQTSGNSGDPQRLRIGLRAAAANSDGWDFWWLCELLACDLPASGSATVRLLAGQHVSFLLQPVPALQSKAGFELSAASFGVTADWSPGSSMQMRGVVTGLSVTSNGNNVTVPTIQFPPAAPIDVTNAAPLGIPLASFESLVRMLLSRAALSWGGVPGFVAAAFLGLHRNLPGLPATWPELRDPGVPGSMFTNPPAALRDWMARVATGVTADGTPLLPMGLAWLASVLKNELPKKLPTGKPELPRITGAGVYEDPWSLTVTAPEVRPLELLAWLEPAGPPSAWAAPLAAQFAACSSLQGLFTLASRLAPFVPAVRESLAGIDVTRLGAALFDLNSYLVSSDGVVPTSSQIPTGGLWTAGTPVESSHDRQPSNASVIGQALAKIAQWAPAQRAVLLIGPAFADKTAWTAFLAQAPGVKNAAAHFNLRQPGLDPGSVDLTSVTVTADYYTADLFDSGTGDHASLTMQIGRVVDRIKALRPGLKVTIVAHSTAGIAARLYTAANAANVLGLITIGTPHAGATLLPILDEDVASAVRLIRSLGLTLPAGSIKNALDHITRALDEYLPPPAAGQLPVSAPYPVESFASPAGTDTGTVPAFALAGSVNHDFFGQLRTAFVNLANAAAAAPRPAPTHLAFGIRDQMRIPPPAENEPSVDARLRADAFRIALQAGAPQPPRPERSVSVNISLERPNGWLLGSSISFVEGAPHIQARVRRADLSLTIAPAPGSVTVTPVVRLYDAGWHAPVVQKLELGNAAMEPLLGALFQAISPAALGTSSGIPALFDALDALELVVPGLTGGFTLSAAGFAALQIDAAGFLLPRLGTALDMPGGLAGLTGEFGGPYVLPTPIGPFELYLARTPSWRIGLRTTTALPVPGGSFSLNASLALPAFTPSLELTLQFFAITLTWSQATGKLMLSAPPWVPSLTLIPPPTPAVFTSTLNAAIPRLLLSAAASPILEAALGGALPLGPIDRVIGSPGSSMQSSGATGDGGGFDGAIINMVLERIAKIAGLPPGPGITLPGGVRLTASGKPDVTFLIETVNPIGGVLSLSLTATVDESRHMTPGGTAMLHVVPGGTWPSVDITFGVSPSGVTLVVDPAGVGPIQLLPTFSGLGSLAGQAQSLLTTALDAVDTHLSAPWYPNLRAVAEKLGLYQGSYQAKEENWKKLLNGQWLVSMDGSHKSQAAGALSTFLGALGFPGNFSTSEATAVWSFTPAGTAGTIGVKAGWKNSGEPILQVQATNLKFTSGPLALNFSAGFVPGPDPVQCSAGLTLALGASAGLLIQPEFSFVRSGNTYECKLLPLGTGTDTTFKIRFAPSPSVTLPASGVAAIASNWVLPLVTSVLIQAAKPLNRKLWTNGKTIEEILTGAQILPGPMPALNQVVGKLLASLGAGAGINIKVSDNPPLFVGFVQSGGVFGIRFSGKAEFHAGDIKVGVLFGGPASIAPEPDAGVSLLLFTQALQFQPRLRVIGLGVSFSKDGGAPLLALPIFRMGSFTGSLFFELNLLNFTFTNNPKFGAGIELGSVSLPLGQAISGNLGGDNPVAASMLESDGSAGKPQPPAPTLDVICTYKNEVFAIKFHGQVAIWIPIQTAFGPIYIEQIGLELLKNATEMALLIDGSVKINGLTVQADDLGVVIPFKSLSSPGQWRLDLRGLAVSYIGDGVTILGGLRKNPGLPVQYDGMLSVDVAGKGFTAVGSYARPSDAQGEYTSLFIFVSLPIPLGGPPCFFVMGLGGGAGVNRQLIVPEDIEKVPQFFLVQAIDDPSFGNDPMGALLQMSNAVPPKRGSFWFAAGVRFTSFVIVKSVAVIYVALDRGFEIGVLGVSRMALPTEELALASVELALKARFSSAEGILSIQAQLTENSYILTRECRLTGGFAFFVWFPKGQFVLTLGGYHKNFKAPKEFPVVPRLGFRMRSGPVVVKGESYFALTNSCVMAGGRLEVAYDLDWVRAWFAAWADFLISWDPFFYDIDIGVEIGVSAHIEVCFIACGTISFDLSIGAELHIFGPELHADVTIDLEVVSFTISFGASPDPEPDYITSWNTFRDKYITTGDDSKGVSLRVTDGLLAPDPPGAEPAPGTKSQPWRLNAEFGFMTETQMPAMSWSTFAGSSGGKVSAAADLQIAPMKKLSITSNHDITLFVGDTGNVPTIKPGHFRMTSIVKPFPEATWRHSEKQKAAANTLPALAGLTIVGAALLKGQSALIPISTMIDDLPSLSLPLPFATLTSGYIVLMKSYGTAAADIWAEIAPVTSDKMLAGAQKILSGTGEFAELRQQAGLPAGGISPLAQNSLMSRRSAPPLVLPLTSGLTMLPPNLAPPPPLYQVPETRPVGLRGYRLVAVLQGQLLPMADAPPSIHTSVYTVEAAKGAPRVAPPKAMALPGAMLKRVPAMRAPRPTRTTRSFRTLLSPQLGICSSLIHSQEFAKAAELVRGDGVTIPAGTTHVWEIPQDEKTFVTLSGTAAARVVFLSAGGRILGDLELVPEGTSIPVPVEASTVAITCLGQLPREMKGITPGFAAVTLAAAPRRGLAAVGWELDDTREQIATSVILGRGSTLVLARPHYTTHRGQKTHWSMARLAVATREQRGIETRLPSAVSVVMIILDGKDSCAAERGDLAIGCDGATLATPAIPVGGGHRRAVLYDVLERDRERDFFTVSVVSEEGWRLAGVVGLKGKATEWAERLHGGIPEDLAPNGPLTPYGSVRVRFGSEPEKGDVPRVSAEPVKRAKSSSRKKVKA